MMNDFSLYRKDEGVFNNRFVTKLLHNYRCGSRDGYRPLLDRNYVFDFTHLLIYVHNVFVLFRSHPAILKIPNELFYDGELQVCADEILRNSYCSWEYLPKWVMISLFSSTTQRHSIQKFSQDIFFNIYIV